MIPHSRDLFLSQEVTTAITDPRLIPVCVTVVVTLSATSGFEVLCEKTIVTANNINEKEKNFVVIKI